MAKDKVITSTKPIRSLPLVLLLGLFYFLSGCAGQLQPREAMVATAHPLATQAALRSLDAGGNAFDAAVAAASVLAVVEPYSAGLGGGGLWLLQKNTGEATFIDARETAPAAAARDMYLDSAGVPRKDFPSRNGALAAAIPGQAAAFAHINERYALRPLSANLSDAILFAQRGFRTDHLYRKMAGYRLDALKASPASTKIFLNNGELPDNGFAIKQPELANTLFQLGRKGREAFYEGELAEKLVQDVRQAGGIWSLEDLHNYHVIERQPIKFESHGYQILSAPPPSSGGIALNQMFGILDRLPESNDLLNTAHGSATRTHLLSEIMSLAYRDRSRWLGDSDFIKIPQAELVSDLYLTDLAKQVDVFKHYPTDNTHAIDTQHHTTHLSIIDKSGNRVAATFSINLPFGSGFTSEATGLLLNNEMDDFSIAPGIPNAYGLTGNIANEIAPGKRPLSSMSPTIAESAEKVIIIGTPGGSRIISMVFLGLLDAIAGKNALEVVSAPRFHHQHSPDEIQYEPQSLTDESMQQLINLGHHLKNTGRQYGNMQLIIWNKDSQTLDGASDPRGKGQTLHR